MNTTRVLVDLCVCAGRGSPVFQSAVRIDQAIWNEQWSIALREALQLHSAGEIPQHLQSRWRDLVNAIQEQIQ